MQNMVCRSVNEPFSSSNDCSSPPFAISNINAVSTFVSCTECNLTICSESAHSNRIAISWRISLSVHCARRLRLRNFAAKLTPVFLCDARRTVANLPLFNWNFSFDFAQSSGGGGRKARQKIKDHKIKFGLFLCGVKIHMALHKTKYHNDQSSSKKKKKKDCLILTRSIPHIHQIPTTQNYSFYFDFALYLPCKWCLLHIVALIYIIAGNQFI